MLYTPLRALLSAGIALLLIAPSTVFAASSPPTSDLASTSWAGTVTFISGKNTGVIEHGFFRYNSDGTVNETTNGPLGNFTGTGTWEKGSNALTSCKQLIISTVHSEGVTDNQLEGHIFANHFIEPTTNTQLEVIVNECGLLSSDNTTYTAYGHGQVYSTSNGQLTPLPNSGSDTISQMTKQ